VIHKTRLKLYSKPRKGGIYAIEINKGDELIQAKLSSGEQDVLLATNNGKSIRFNENQIRSTGRKTKGVKGIRMSFKDDFVIGMLVVKREGQVLVVSSKGFGKRSKLEKYREQKRGGKGVFTLKANKKTGKLISIMEVVNEDDLMIITDTGIMIRQSIDKLNVIGRNTQGVKLLRLDEKSSIASVTKVIKEENEDPREKTTTEETTN
jgi:DNA gyrase subunit A